MNAPQIIIIGLIFLQLGVALAKDGQPKDEKWSFNRTLFSASLWSVLLWWGGFFNG